MFDHLRGVSLFHADIFLWPQDSGGWSLFSTGVAISKLTCTDACTCLGGGVGLGSGAAPELAAAWGKRGIPVSGPSLWLPRPWRLFFLQESAVFHRLTLSCCLVNTVLLG